MAYPLDNLGDFNLAREMVMNAGGSFDKAIEKVITDAAPELLRRGQLQGAAVVGGASLLLGGGIWLGRKLVNRSKSKTSSIENVEVDGKNPSSESVVPSANNEAEDADKEAVNDRVAKD
ncbi:hypothetical protein [Corynebacterium flavescens]|uniref:hypothetical protein n=1 Tax=Corynebacterium flavescens TaxID=28028 RepID=UPI000EE0A1E3|nr:hypothetical protein [Corynebacterium flavescens]